MKRIIVWIIAVSAAVITCKAQAEPNYGLPEDALKTLKGYFWMYENDMPETAFIGMDSLARAYPDNYVVLYERLTCLYKLERYDEVVDGAKKLFGHKDESPLVYQICGNALDMMGKRAEAQEIYKEGLKNFPDAGMLYLELGVVELNQKKYDSAFNWFNAGIQACPMFPSNYYRAAQLYFDSTDRVWGLVYAETEMMLAHDNGQRFNEMAADIVDAWKKAISVKIEADSTEITISLADTDGKRSIKVDQENKTCYLCFSNVFEDCAAFAVHSLFGPSKPYDGLTLSVLTEIRREIVEIYFSATENLFGNSMYLFPFQKKVIDAGHWEAYNFWILGSEFPEEASEWCDNNRGRLQAFVDWYNAEPFELDKDHTVGISTIYRDYRKIDMFDVLGILLNLKANGEKKDAEND